MLLSRSKVGSHAEASMSARRLVAESEFDPETIRSMSDALAGALTALGLRDTSDGFTELVARKTIALARHGERDPARLKDAVLRSFRN
jgi:hypothetical protein